MSSEFSGFPEDVIRFYEELHENNERDWFKANKDRYDAVAKAPMDALLRSFEGLYGERRLFRPYHDMRFARDRPPIKESISGSLGGHVGHYLSLGRNGLFVGAGVHGMHKDALEAYRSAVADDSSGEALAAILADLEGAKFALSQPDLKRVPSGFDAEHPRGDLLRRKSVMASREVGKPKWLFQPEARDRILEIFTAVEPLSAWLRRHVA